MIVFTCSSTSPAINTARQTMSGRVAALPDGLHVTLKSGNCGTPDFFRKALRVLAA